MTADVDFSTKPVEEDAPMVVRSLADRIAADLAARRRKVIEVVHPDVPKWRAT